MAVCETAIHEMRTQLAPGMTENALWWILHQVNIARGDEQRRLYALAREHLAFNTDALKPGMTFKEFAEKSLALPEKFQDNRYSVIAHGVGLCDEYPHIAYVEDIADRGYDGVIEPGMTLCFESYIGADGGREDAKLEQQVLVTDTGIEALSTFPFENALL